MVKQIDQRGVREQFGLMQIVGRHQRLPAEVLFVYGRQMNHRSQR